jgi:Spy/CpxP family protein refolding chaperone
MAFSRVRGWWVALVVAVVSVSVLPAPASAQEGKAKKAPKKEGESKGKKKEARGRLPAGYGDLVTDEQRDRIYSIQGKYADQIAGLQKQLEDLRDKQTAEIEAVLTAEQKAKLAQARAAKKKPGGKKEAGDKGEKAPPGKN